MGFTIPADTEMALRLGVFLAMFAVLALWEWAAPARTARLSRALRWRANLGLAVLNTALLRVALPGSALAFAALAAQEGWGLLNRYAVPDWADATSHTLDRKRSCIASNVGHYSSYCDCSEHTYGRRRNHLRCFQTFFARLS